MTCAVYFIGGPWDLTKKAYPSWRDVPRVILVPERLPLSMSAVAGDDNLLPLAEEKMQFPTHEYRVYRVEEDVFIATHQGHPRPAGIV